MSVIMIAAGSTRGSSMRTVSIRTLVASGALVAAALLTAGAGLGCWWSARTAEAPPGDASPRPRAAMPFAVEKLGELSGRLFKLESQAGQLSERIGAMQTPPALPARHLDAHGADRGGPLLPARPDELAWDAVDELQSRLLAMERQIALVSDAASLRNLALMRLPTHLPLKSAELVSSFGNREDPLTGHTAFHAGLDFAARTGTAILAAAGGNVTFAGFKPDFGWVVELEHGNGLSTRYAHASRVLVHTGELVEPGDAIAAVGSTGRSTGPHLHFEVLRHGEAVDPRAYLAGL